MKILQIGLGSMGKRRIRNFHSIGLKDIIGFDFREDRRKESEERYGIKTTDKLTDAVLSDRDFFVISTPPDRHLEYLKLAVKTRKPAFVEASVIKEGLSGLNNDAKARSVLIAPSCTFRFHPAVKTIKDIVSGGKYGKVCGFVYHMGQFLPDWHPWEDIRDFYVSKRETSACREMVPFELTWLVDIAGIPREVFAFYGKTIDLGVDIDDSYSVNLKFNDFIGSIFVDVVSRYATRSLTLNLERAQVRWNWEDKVVKLYEADNKRWVHYFQPDAQAEAGYNINIAENMYIDEMRAFIDAVKGVRPFPNTLEDDIAILDILENIERTNNGRRV